jgi:hypothetical protein
MTSSHQTLAAAIWRIAIALTVVVIAIYFGFIALDRVREGMDGLADRPGVERGNPVRRDRDRVQLAAHSGFTSGGQTTTTTAGSTS